MINRLFGWGTVMAQTDVPDHDGGGCLWTRAKVRPWWYWLYRRLHLFLGVVWRRWEPEFDRISVRDAWAISECAVGLSRKDCVRETPLR